MARKDWQWWLMYVGLPVIVTGGLVLAGIRNGWA